MKNLKSIVKNADVRKKHRKVCETFIQMKQTNTESQNSSPIVYSYMLNREFFDFKKLYEKSKNVKDTKRNKIREKYKIIKGKIVNTRAE